VPVARFALPTLRPCSPSALPQRWLPDPLDKPGAVNPAVTQQNIDETICRPGWARTIRPPQQYTRALKRRQLGTWVAYAGGPLRAFEEDHLIALELGGAPVDQRNYGRNRARRRMDGAPIGKTIWKGCCISWSAPVVCRSP
jgi:hypothetical protein